MFVEAVVAIHNFSSRFPVCSAHVCCQTMSDRDREGHMETSDRQTDRQTRTETEICNEAEVGRKLLRRRASA